MKPLSFHSRHSRRGAVCTLLLATQLTACGGDDNDASPPAPSGDDPPPAAMVSLTLAGTVTDAPIANAVVTATVGAETFTATADANGVYSLDIEIEEANAADFVTLNARGAGDQAFVEFTSLAGSFQSLAAQAGEDGALSKDENFSTQITNVSTAEAVLLVEANGGEAVTSDAVLQSLGSAINGQEVLDLATAIKLAVDESADYPMPEGHDSILDLASDAAARRQFIDEAYEQNPETFATAQTSIAQDPSLSQPLSAADVPADLTAALLSTDAGFTFNYSNRVSSYTFAADGTGFATSGSFDQAMTWTVDGSTIEVMFTAPVATVSYDTENCDGTVRQVEAHYLSEGVTLSLLSERTLATTETSDVSYADCPALADREVTLTSARTILTDADFQVIDVEELRGAAQTIYVYDGAQGAVVADVADVNADGTGVTWQTNKTFTWTVDSTGHVITATFDDGSVAEYRSLRDVDEVTSDLFHEITTAGGVRFVDAGASVLADPEVVDGFTAEDVPGRFYQFGIGNEAVADARLKGFRLRFDADGFGAQEDDYIDESGAVVTTNEITSPFNALRWTVEDFDVIVRRTVNLADGSTSCLFGTTDCLLWDIRRIMPLAMEGSRVYWLEQRTFDEMGVTSATPTTSLVRFYDFEPLSGAAAAAKPGNAVNGSKARALLRGPQLR